MSLFQVRRAVVRDPHLPLQIFRNQNFQRQIDGHAWRGEHERRAFAFATMRCEGPGSDGKPEALDFRLTRAYDESTGSG